MRAVDVGVAVRHDREHAGVGGDGHDMAEQVHETGRVGPVCVVDSRNTGNASAVVAEDVDDRVEEQQPLRLGVGSR